MKRLLSVLLVAVLMLAMLPLTSQPALMVQNSYFDVSVNKETARIGDVLRWEITNLKIYTYSYYLGVYWKSGIDVSNDAELVASGEESFIEVTADKPGVYYASAMLTTSGISPGSVATMMFGDSVQTIVGDELLLDLKIDPIKVAVDKGQSITGSWSATGGVPPYTYDYEWVISSTDGYELTEKSDQNSADEKDTIKPLWGETGTLQVLVKDRVGQTVLRKATFGITGAPVEPLDLQLTLEDSVSLGETIIGSCRISDGSAPYKYTYRWYIRIEGASEDILASINRDVPEAEDVFIPGFGDIGKLSVQVIDAAGRRGKAEASFDIEGNATEGPLQLHIFLNNDSTAIGEEIEGSWYAVGGTPPYRYAYYWYVYDEFVDESHHSGANMEVAVDESYSNVYRFAPSRGNKGEMLVSVWDSLDNQVYHKIFFDITEKEEPTPTPAPTATPTPTPTAEPTVTPALKGDATNDGTVDILDLVSIIDYIVSNTNPTSAANADANGDGTVDIMDLVWIIDQIVGG